MRRTATVATLGMVIGLAYAADQTILGKKEVKRDRRSGVATARRKLFGQGLAEESTNTIMGDPTVGGATLTFLANGATSSQQAFDLPAAHWSTFGTTGFRYDDATGMSGPV